MIKVIVICVFVPLEFATVMALISHWRDGTWQTHVTPVFLRFEKFAQQIPFRAVWRHVCNHWMYYGIVAIFGLAIVL